MYFILCFLIAFTVESLVVLLTTYRNPLRYLTVFVLIAGYVMTVKYLTEEWWTAILNTLAMLLGIIIGCTVAYEFKIAIEKERANNSSDKG